MTRQRIRQVEQANLHPVDGSLGVFGQVGQLLPRDVPAANERLLVESAQHLLLQRLGRVRLRPQQHPRTRYTAANPLVMSLEPADDSALTAIQSGTQQFVADHAAGRQ